MSTETAAPTPTYDWLTLDEGENVLWSSVPHKYSLVPAFVIGLPLSLILVGIPIIVSAYLWRENTVYVITNRALYAKSGVLSRDVQRIDFGKVQNITYTQGVFGTQFGYGNVDISTAGSSGVEMRFTSIPDPKAVADRVKARVRDDEAPEADDTDAVLDDILRELQAIRETLEGDSVRAAQDRRSDSAPNSGSNPDSTLDTNPASPK